MIDLTKFLLEENNKPRQIGRYRVSELWAMFNGYILPENYLQQEILSVAEIIKLKKGEMKHSLVRPYLNLLGYQCEIPLEYKVSDDIVIVGRVDGMKDNEIIEIKTSDDVLTKSKRWHDFQLKTYLSIFEKPRGIICQPVFTNDKFYLKILKEIVRDDNWFHSEVIEPLIIYHQKVVKHYNYANQEDNSKISGVVENGTDG